MIFKWNKYKYYSMRFCTLFKLSVLTGLFWHLCGRGSGAEGGTALIVPGRGKWWLPFGCGPIPLWLNGTSVPHCCSLVRLSGPKSIGSGENLDFLIPPRDSITGKRGWKLQLSTRSTLTLQGPGSARSAERKSQPSVCSLTPLPQGA